MASLHRLVTSLILRSPLPIFERSLSVPSSRALLSTTRLNSQLIPMVVSSEPGSGERSYDIFSRLLKERIIILQGPIDDATSSVIIAQLLFLESEQAESPISLYINSGGGNVTSGLAIYDTMQFVQSPIQTICMGQCSSMASLLLAAGEPGFRVALPNSSIMIHQPSGGSSGQASDMHIVATEILRVRDRMVDIYSVHCSKEEESRDQSRKRFARLLDRDHYLTAEGGIREGLIDRIITKRPVSSSIES